jgi:predicted metal-dependent hydrolase
MSVAYKLQYGTHPIDFTVVRRERRTMQISVLPDMSVEVVAPVTANEKDILERMTKRAGWICRQIRIFQQYMPRTPARRFVAGETHLYLGRCYRLKINRAEHQDVKLKRGFIEVHTRSPSQKGAVREQVEQWLKARAHECFRNRLDVCLQKFHPPSRYRPNGLIIRQLKQRWGSMSLSGRLVLNRDLVQASVQEIDYVITHELCHRLHLHHGPAFFDLLSRVMPDWKARKRSLERRLA